MRNKTYFSSCLIVIFKIKHKTRFFHFKIFVSKFEG